MLPIMVEPAASSSLIRIEFKNVRPVDLIDLAVSLRAFGEAYSDFAHDEGWDVSPENVRLHVHRLQTGSIIGELAPYADQASWLLDEAKTLLPFVKAFGGLASFFLGKGGSDARPNRRQAEQISAIMEPTARDQGSQLNIGAINGPVTIINNSYSSQEANAVQNAARRLIGPSMPASQVMHDQVLTLHQVRGDISLKAGDRGIIETVSPKHLKLNFMTPEAKRMILDATDNPFKMAFLVDVEVRAVDGKPALYRILEVKDVFDRPI